ncbi:MAG: hypothetical protein FWH18_08730 [Marinilabiliaceae bacterium]|nr:hypothetical protein [Marinilabiliaceae bacterium]
MKVTIKLCVFACLFAGLIFMGCDDSSGGIDTGTEDDPEENNEGRLSNNTIKATVEGGDAYNNLVDEVLAYMGNYLIAECEYKNGGFELKLPANVTSNRLWDIGDYWEGWNWMGNITFNNPSAMLNGISLLAFKNGENVGTFSYYNHTATTRSEAYYLYVDADVTVNASEGYTFNFSVDLPLKKGWNEIFHEFSESSSGTSYTISMKKPSGIKWQLEYTGDNDDGPVMNDNKITAKVEYGNDYNGYINEVWAVLPYYDYNGGLWEDYIAAKGKYSNGGFTIELPSSVNSLYLLEIFFGNDWQGNFTVSDPSAKIGELNLLATDADGKYLGNFSYSYSDVRETSTSFSSKWIYLSFIYADKDVSANGSFSSQSSLLEYGGSLNISLKKGWNEVFFVFDSSYDYTTEYETIFQTITTTRKSGLEWGFYEWADDWKSTTSISMEKSMPFGMFNQSLK